MSLVGIDFTSFFFSYCRFIFLDINFLNFVFSKFKLNMRG